MLDVTLSQRKVPKAEEKVLKQQYDWRFENSINTGNEPIQLDNEFKYSQWRTNTSLSSHIDCILIVNEVNIHCNVTDQQHYDFLFNSIKKKKRYGKKKTEEEKREERKILKEQEDIQAVQDYYKYNVSKAKMALKILTADQLEKIKTITGGIK